MSQDATARPFVEPTSAMPLDPTPFGSPDGSGATMPQQDAAKNPFAEQSSGASPFSQAANPYQSPKSMSTSSPLTREMAMQRVRGPALGIQIVAIISLVMQGLFLVFIFGMAIAGEARMEEVVPQVIGQGFGIGISATMVFGAIRMKRLSSYPLALSAAILAMLPCSGCCMLSLPFGIWALVVLVDNQVKASFE